MRIALIQTDIMWAKTEENRLRLSAMMERFSAEAEHKAELYVLPEMFSTGFATAADAEIEDEPSESLEWMKAKAAELDAAICGSIALRLKDGRRVNRMYFVYPDRGVVHYDKRHLFTYGGEDRSFSAGEERVIIEYRGVRFLLAVCYDLRFPVWLRNRKDYDAMIIVASWPERRRFAWDTLLKARAIENQCFVLAVNRVGEDPNCSYNGGSAVISPKGEIVAGAEDSKASCVYAEMNMEELKAFRTAFPVLEDKDQFNIVL